MNSQARRILRKLGYDKRPWTFETVERCCELAGVELTFMPMRRAGVYWMPEGAPTITLSSSLAGIKKLEAGCHELGHHFEHSPESGLYIPECKGRREFEAQRFAVCALIPEWMRRRLAHQYMLWDLQEEYGYTANLFEFRSQVYHQCGAEWWKR